MSDLIVQAYGVFNRRNPGILLPRNSKFGLKNEQLRTNFGELLRVYNSNAAYSEHLSSQRDLKSSLVERDGKFRSGVDFNFLSGTEIKAFNGTKQHLEMILKELFPDKIFPHQRNPEYLYSIIFLNGISYREVFERLGEQGL